jgi:hypothetical protein
VQQSAGFWLRADPLARAQGFIAEKTSTPLISEKMHGTGLGALTGFPCRVPVWELIEKIGRGEGIRTPGLLVPNNKIQTFQVLHLVSLTNQKDHAFSPSVVPNLYRTPSFGVEHPNYLHNDSLLPVKNEGKDWLPGPGARLNQAES